MPLLAEETKIVTIDNQARPIEDLPDQARQLVRFYDDWKQKELQARSDLLLAQTGMRAMANEIAALVQKADEERQAAAAEAEAGTDAAEGEGADA